MITQEVHSRNSSFRSANSVFEVSGEVPAFQPEEKAQMKLSPRFILTASCVIAVLVDPLFFYLPIIDEKKKCIGMDTKLRNVALIFRSLTDIGFIVLIIQEFREAVEAVSRETRNHRRIKTRKPNRDEICKFAKALARKLSWHTIVTDFFAVLPIPQVVIVAVRSSRHLGQRKIPNFFLLAQYVPRVYRMRHLSIKYYRNKTGMWVKGSFYFFLYLLAGHVLGGFWYYFSIQQEISCWYRACKKHSTRGCNFYCHDNMTSRNMTFIDSLDKFCLVDVPTNETAPFDFGIFFNSLKNGNTGSIHFVKKLFYSFWWGLRNLSNFGTNLETSTYVWENCFAILISAIGLLLFLYLIGRVQTFLSIKTEKSVEEFLKSEGEEISESKTKLILKKLEVKLWMKRNNLNIEMKNEIQENIERLKWEKIRDDNMDNLLSIFSMLPPKTKKSLKYFLCMKTLTKVPKLKNLKNKALLLICAHLKPVVYQDNSFIFQLGEPVDRILFVTEGLVWTHEAAASSNTNSCTSQDVKGKTIISFLRKGGFYGDVDLLLSWAIASHKNDLSFGKLPISNANVKCHGKVEGFVLMAKDLKTVVSSKHGVFLNSDERMKAAVQTIENEFRRFKDRRQRKTSLWGDLSNKVKVFFHCCDSTHLAPSASVPACILEDDTQPLATVLDRC